MAKGNAANAFERFVPAPTYFIRFSGIWDMQDLYENMAAWFKYKKYKFNEVYNEQREPTPFGNERIYIWEAVRNENDYVQIRYDMYFQTWDVYDFEATLPNGETKSLNKGRLWLEIRCVVLYDFEKRWDDNAFHRHLKDFYNKYITKKKTMYEYSPKFRTEAYTLHSEIRKRLKMINDKFEHEHGAGVHGRP